MSPPCSKPPDAFLVLRHYILKACFNRANFKRRAAATASPASGPRAATASSAAPKSAGCAAARAALPLPERGSTAATAACRIFPHPAGSAPRRARPRASWKVSYVGPLLSDPEVDDGDQTNDGLGVGHRPSLREKRRRPAVRGCRMMMMMMMIMRAPVARGLAFNHGHSGANHCIAPRSCSSGGRSNSHLVLRSAG